MLALLFNTLLLLLALLPIALGRLRVFQLFQVLTEILQVPGANVSVGAQSIGCQNLQEEHVGVELGCIIDQADALDVPYYIL